MRSKVEQGTDKLRDKLRYLYSIKYVKRKFDLFVIDAIPEHCQYSL